MEKCIRIYCKNTQTFIKIEGGTTLSSIYKSLKLNLKWLCVGAIVNNRAEGLNYRVYKPKDIEFIDISSSSGMRIYVRSLCFVLYMATDEILPGCRLRIEHSISRGYYCTLKTDKPLTPDIIFQIKERMKAIISSNLPYILEECHTTEAVRLFKEKNLSDKVDLLETLGMLYTSFYRLDHHIDYYYGSLLPTTGLLYLFNLLPYNKGMLLVIPQRNNPDKLEKVFLQPKMMQVLEEFTEFNRIAGLSNVGKMNKLIKKGQASTLLKVNEALQEKKIASIADEIVKRGNIKVVLISGPSSSGKTTFSKRLSVQLMTNLIRPVTISLDNYFVDREHTPLDENGEYDFESIKAFDLALFNQNIQALINGEDVELPYFDFTSGKRQYNGEKTRLRPDSILILEGIHALNPILLDEIPDSLKYKIYVSALTSISLDDHNWIPTTDNRLIRRIVRDNLFRGYTATQTIARWDSVRKGEEKWIFPYQENADAMFNSAMLYELAVLKEYAEPVLREVDASLPEFAEAYRLQRFLSYFIPIHHTEIPPTSLLREFLGGSSFKY